MEEKKSVKKATVNKEKQQQDQVGCDDMEKSITQAMRSRVGHFKDQANSLTLEGVRRVVEEDLGLDRFALDAHKRFIKQCLQECFDGTSDENGSKSSAEETVEGVVNPKKEETPDISEEVEDNKEVKELSSEDEEKMLGSPVQGLLGDITTPNKTKEAKGVQVEKLSKGTIKKAIRKRASYFRAHSESVTMAGVRRLLEEDLKLDKNTLDPYKTFISEQLDEVVQSSEVAEPANGDKNKGVKKGSVSKASTKVRSKGSSESSDSKDEQVDGEELKPKTKIPSKGKALNSEVKNHKGPAKETRTSSNKRKRVVEQLAEESNAKDGNPSEDGQPHSSDEEPVKKKRETSTPVYGKNVEHLKSVIKSCGMSVPPAVYKKAKQAKGSNYEATLVKELEEILRREGLSTNPSEKEIKAVKKQKERTKELEGIDLSNIVSSSRRRSTSSFVPPPKPKTPVESDDEDNEDKDDQEDDGSDDEDDAGESESEAASDELNDDAEDVSD